jgi:hypothetical protein
MSSVPKHTSKRKGNGLIMLVPPVSMFYECAPLQALNVESTKAER